MSFTAAVTGLNVITRFNMVITDLIVGEMMGMGIVGNDGDGCGGWVRRWEGFRTGKVMKWFSQ